jgi:hypothetical protein
MSAARDQIKGYVKKLCGDSCFVWYPVLTSVGSNEKAWMLSLQLAVYIFAVNLIPFCHIR